MAIAQNFPEIAPSLNLDFSNVKALDPRVTFSRASSATYYGTETAKAEENLLVRSQEFDNAAWFKSNTTVTANTETAPDGTTTAETITATVGTASHSVAQVFTSIAAVHTFSVFAKAGTLDYIQLRFAAAVGAAFVNFDITLGAGAIGTSGGSGSPSGTITDVGNGWFRCSITATITAGAASPAIFLVTSDNAVSAESWTAAGTETVFLWGCQLEQRSAVTSYQPTTTQPITRFQPVLESEPAGVARFDHNPLTFESLGLLVEESRTNLLLRSEEFDNASWTKNASTITANTIVAPDGTLTGDKLVENTASASHDVTQTISAAAVSTLTVFAKKGERNHVYLMVLGTSGRRAAASFNLDSGTVRTTYTNVYTLNSTDIEPIGNDWFRCAITFTPDGTAATVARYGADDGTTAINDSGVVYTGDGFSGIFIWGAQLEAGAFPTSYIKTVASQVTRSADSASMTGANFSSWYRQDEGTMYGDALFGDLTSGRLLASITGAINADRLTIGLGGIYSAASVVDNSVQANLSFGTKTANSKIAFAYKVNDFAASGNGSSVSTDTSGTLPVVDRLFIGSRVDFNPAVIANGHIRKLSFYPQRLTNAQLQALTG